MMNIKLYLLIVAGLFLLTSKIGFAFECGPPSENASEELKKSKAVFAGKVINIKTADYIDEVKFKVTESWKDVDTDEVVVFTGHDGSREGYKFEVGESYLVFADSSSKYELATSVCKRTKRLRDAQKDLEELGPGKDCQSKTKTIE